MTMGITLVLEFVPRIKKPQTSQRENSGMTVLYIIYSIMVIYITLMEHYGQYQ
jgi:hypothetical protein